MNNDRELLQQALDALSVLTKEMLACRDELAERGARPETPHKQKLWDSAFNAYTGMASQTYEAIRARLAQPDSATHSADSAESFCNPETMACSVLFPRHAPKHGEDWIIDPAFLLRVYHSIDPDAHYGFIPTMEEIETALLALEVIPSNLYATPPRRERIVFPTMTDEWITATADSLEVWDDIQERFVLNPNTFARAIEAKLKEKNT